MSFLDTMHAIIGNTAKNDDASKQISSQETDLKQPDNNSGQLSGALSLEEKIARVMAGINNPATKYPIPSSSPAISSMSGSAMKERSLPRSATFGGTNEELASIRENNEQPKTPVVSRSSSQSMLLSSSAKATDKLAQYQNSQFPQPLSVQVAHTGNNLATFPIVGQLKPLTPGSVPVVQLRSLTPVGTVPSNSISTLVPANLQVISGAEVKIARPDIGQLDGSEESTSSVEQQTAELSSLPVLNHESSIIPSIKEEIPKIKFNATTPFDNNADSNVPKNPEYSKPTSLVRNEFISADSNSPNIISNSSDNDKLEEDDNDFIDNDADGGVQTAPEISEQPADSIPHYPNAATKIILPSNKSITKNSYPAIKPLHEEESVQISKSTTRIDTVETIRDGDFSMRSRTTPSRVPNFASPNANYTAGSRGKPKSNSKVDTENADNAKYSFDNWSASARQSHIADDLISVSDVSRRSHTHTSVNGSTNGDGIVRVACRVRPFSVGEMQSGARRVVSMNGDKLIVVNPKAFEAEPDVIAAVAAAASLENMRCNDWAKVFRFDHCLWSFDPMSASDDTFCDQYAVHEQLGQNLVRDMLNGIPVTCFAYGNTGTGKTYTMFGSNTSSEDIDGGIDLEVPADAGLIPRIFTDIINGVFPPDADPEYSSNTRITISFLEIYQEKIRDLLDTGNGDSGELRIREHPSTGPYVENLSKIQVKTPGEMLALLKAGVKSRRSAHNSLNQSSSRSHAIVTLEMSPVDSPPISAVTQSRPRNSANASKFPHDRIRATMIDLAGSEKEQDIESNHHSTVKSWKSPKTREEISVERLELKMIRKSLSTLGYIIKALGQGISVRGMPFRDSALTWLLKDSLSGHCALAMVSTISPADTAYEETINTLKYAERLCALSSLSGSDRQIRNTGAVSISDTIDPALTFAIASEYSRLKQELSGNSTKAARHLLKQTIADPQQRLAKLGKDDDYSVSRNTGNSKVISTPNNSLVALSSGTPRSIVPATPSADIDSLKETYRQLHGRFIELQIELENARTDRDGLELELQDLRASLDASKNGAANQQSRLFLTPNTDMGTALLAAEDEIAELKSTLQRKDEASDRLLNELAEERHIRSTIERTAKGQVMDLISRVESIQKQSSIDKEEAKASTEKAVLMTMERDAAENTVAALKAEIVKSKDEINLQTVNLESVIDSLRRQVNELIKERESLDPRAKEAQREKEDMLLKMNSMVTRIEELNGKLEECYRQLGRTESDLKEAAKEKANWLDRENAWIKRVQDIQSALERTERDKTTLLAREGAMTKQVLDMEMAIAGSDSKYKSQLEVITLERDSLIEIVRQQGQALHVQQQQAEASLKMLYQRQGALERIEHQTVDSKSMEELSKLQDELHALMAREGQTLHSELMSVKQLMVIVASLKDRIIDMDMIKDELDFERNERRRLENKLSDMIEEAEMIGTQRHQKALIEGAVLSSSSMGSQISELKDQVEHFRKLSSGWESRAHYWQQIAKKQIGGNLTTSLSTVGEDLNKISVLSSPHTAPNLTPHNKLVEKGMMSAVGNPGSSDSRTLDLKAENARLAEQLASAVGDAKLARNELSKSKEDMQKEFTSLWLAVQQLNSLDAAKERALQDLINDRDKAVKEKNAALQQLTIMQKDYAELQSELEEIDSDLLKAADMEGIAIENLEVGVNRRTRAVSPMQNREKQSRPREFDLDKPQPSPAPNLTPTFNRGMQRDFAQVQPSSKKSTSRVNIQTSSRSPDSETEKGLERQIVELSQFLEKDKYKLSSQQKKERMRTNPRVMAPRG